MYKSHPSFQIEDPDDTPIWRYLTLTKYLSLLKQRALHFSRYDAFEDRYEGSYARENLNDVMREVAPYLQPSQGFVGFEDDFPEDVIFGRAVLQSQAHQRMESHRRGRMRIGINCWHKGNHESVAMWKIYMGTGEGVAIQSTIGRLKEALHISDTPIVHLGTVHYTDHLSAIPDRTPFDALLYKRNWFSYEQEIRAMCFCPGVDENSEAPRGFQVLVNINVLVARVIIFPMAPKWFDELVRESSSKFGFDGLSVEKSEMDEPPLP